MNVVASKKRLSLVSAKSDEIQGASIKDAAQTWRPPPETRFHAKGVATALRAVQCKTIGSWTTGHRPVATRSINSSSRLEKMEVMETDLARRPEWLSAEPSHPVADSDAASPAWPYPSVPRQ